MKVIFLDFDGVLNSAASFLYEDRRRKEFKEQGVKGPVNETLCNVATSNFIKILDTYPEVKIVISSTWRNLFSLDWLKDKLQSYHIDSRRVIDKTPERLDGSRGLEIQHWLDYHPEVTQYVIVDDNDWDITRVHPPETFVQTSWDTGLTLPHVFEVIQKLKTRKKDEKDDQKTEG